MKTKSVIILSTAVAALGVAGYSYYKKAMNNFGFDIQGVKINSIQNNVASVDIQFNVWSKLGISFKIKLIQLNLYANGIFVGTVQQTEVVNVPEVGNAVINVTALIDLSVVQSTAFQLLASYFSGQAGLELAMQGYYKFNVNLPLLSGLNIKYDINESYKII